MRSMSPRVKPEVVVALDRRVWTARAFDAAMARKLQDCSMSRFGSTSCRIRPCSGLFGPGRASSCQRSASRDSAWIHVANPAWSSEGTIRSSVSGTNAGSGSARRINSVYRWSSFANAGSSEVVVDDESVDDDPADDDPADDDSADDERPRADAPVSGTSVVVRDWLIRGSVPWPAEVLDVAPERSVISANVSLRSIAAIWRSTVTISSRGV